MGFLQKQSIGMEISHGGIAAVLMSERHKIVRMLRTTRVPLSRECLNQSQKEPQVASPSDFVHVVREAWENLHCTTRQISLSLPDSAGNLLLMSLQDPWRRRSDVLELLRWKLGRRLGIDAGQLHLDFQLLERKPDGSSDLLVALMNRAVILQYEELFLEAGLQPTRISFHTPNVLRLVGRITSDVTQLVTLYDNTLGIMAQTGGRLAFCRVKTLVHCSGLNERLKHELAASLAASRQACGKTASYPWHLFAPPDNTNVAALLTAATGDAPLQVAPDMLFAKCSTLPLTGEQLYQKSAAAGAALREP